MRKCSATHTSHNYGKSRPLESSRSGKLLYYSIYDNRIIMTAESYSSFCGCVARCSCVSLFVYMFHVLKRRRRSFDNDDDDDDELASEWRGGHEITTRVVMNHRAPRSSVVFSCSSIYLSWRTFVSICMIMHPFGPQTTNGKRDRCAAHINVRIWNKNAHTYAHKLCEIGNMNGPRVNIRVELFLE